MLPTTVITFSFLLSIFLFLNHHRYSHADDPRYVANMNKYFNWSKVQTEMFIGDVWPINEANWNTGIVNWPYDNDYLTENPKVLISWGRTNIGKPYYWMQPTVHAKSEDRLKSKQRRLYGEDSTEDSAEDERMMRESNDVERKERSRRVSDAQQQSDNVIVAKAQQGQYHSVSPWPRLLPFNANLSAPIIGTGNDQIPKPLTSTRFMKYFLQGAAGEETNPMNANEIASIDFADMRTFLFHDEIRFHGVASFYDGEYNQERQGMIYGKLQFHSASNTIFTVIEECRRLLIDHEMGKHHEKNWSPFQFDYLMTFQNEKDRETNKETNGRDSGRDNERGKSIQKKDNNDETSLLYEESTIRREKVRDRERERERTLHLRGGMDRGTENHRTLTITVEDELKRMEEKEKQEEEEEEESQQQQEQQQQQQSQQQDSEKQGVKQPRTRHSNAVTGIKPLPVRFNYLYIDYNQLHNKHGSHVHSIQLFVHSINPHRIVYGSNLHDNYPYWDNAQALARGSTGDIPSDGKGHWGILNVSTVCLSEYKPTPERPNFWNYGTPHGGAPSVLIKTKYGPRYLHIFHSQGKYSINYILTYFMGAYLFEATPPFRITHMTPDPIIPNAFYNETYGWAYRAIDYIVFPMGVVVRDDVLYLSSGRNDRSGWMATMNITGLVDYMIPVEFEVKQNHLNDVLLKEYVSLHGGGGGGEKHSLH